MMKDLTKAEIEEKGAELARLVLELDQMQLKNKEKKRKLKEAETELEVEINELALEVKTGQMEVDDQVDAFEDGKKPKKPRLAAVDEEEEKH